MMNFLCFSFEIMSRAKSIAQASAVKIELSIGRAFVFIILFKTAAHAVLLLSLDTYVVRMLLEDILMLFLVGEGMCLCFMELIQLEVNFWIFNDPRLYLWQDALMVDSLRIGSIRRPNGLIDFSFWSKCCLYFGSKVQLYAGLDGEDFSLV